MKDYYQILGVRRGAGLPEIRRAYRILVQKLHPDVNPDPTAHELIKEVNEAYDVLGDEAKKREYDYQLENPSSTTVVPPAPAHRDPAYKRRRTHPGTSETYSQRELMEKYMPYAIWCCRVGLLLSFLIFVDAFLPNRISTEKVEAVYKVGRRRVTTHYQLVTSSGIEIRIPLGELQYFLYQGNRIQLYRTRILAIPVRVSGEHGTPTQAVGHIYRTTIFLPILLFLSSVLGLIFKKRTEFAFSLCTVSGILCVILYFLIK